MRVLTFSTLFPNATQPGHGIFVETRLRALNKRHPFESEVVAPIPWFPFRSARFGRYGRFASSPQQERRDGILVHHPRYPVIPQVGMHIAPALLATWSLSTIKAIRAQGRDFDLIDSHYLYPDGVAAARIAKILDKPLLITARGSDVNLIAKMEGPRRKILDAARTAVRVITVSDALRNSLIDLGVDESRVLTLRNGVDLKTFKSPSDRSCLRARLGYRHQTLISVGNLVELKGHHLVIAALRDLPRVELVLIGDGVMKTELEALAGKLGVAERVRFAGRMTQSELVHHYGAADALVLASSREGWANVLLEAMACGTPVVATPIPGNVEVVRSSDAGLLTQDRSADAIAQACKRLLSSGPFRAATRRYAEDFSWDNTSDGLWRLFQEAAAHPGGPIP